MMKKLVLFVAAVMLLASSAQAALNQFEVTTTNPAILTGTTGQAGKIGFVLRDGTTYGAGNSTKIELPNGVTLAQSYDFYIHGTTNIVGQVDGPLLGTANVSGLVIHVSGTAGARALVMDVVNGTIGVTGTNSATIVLFDGNNATDPAKGAIWKKGWNGTDFNASETVNATSADNTLCITVSESYTDKYVSVALTTTSSYLYNPATPNIAEIKPKSITPVGLKAERTYKLGTGQGAGCMVDYETFAGFCEGGWGSNLRGYVAVQNGDVFPEGTYTVTTEILVDGAVGAKGAYFQGASSKVQFVGTAAALSDSTSTTGELPLGSPVYYLASGSTTTTLPTTCSPADNAKVTKVVSETAANAVTAGLSTSKFLRVDVPSIVLVESELPSNARIGVKVTVSKGCGEFVSESFETLFTVVSECSSITPASTLLFPYFADAPFWNGMALTNTSSAAVTATLTVVDVAGGEGTIAVTVPAKGMYVNTVEAIIADSTFNGTVDAAKRCYVVVTPQSGSLVGFAMMGNAGESMGYTVNN